MSAATVLAREDVIEDPAILLPDRDLRGWDHESVELVLEYQASGWRGRLSANNHAILHAPDGDGTASISRKAKRNRGGLNARRPLEQWRRRKEQEHEEHHRSHVNAFGIVDDNLRTTESEPPWRIAERQSYEARLRMHKILSDWWHEITTDADDGNYRWQLLEDKDDDWAVISIKLPHRHVTIVAFGPQANPHAVEDLRTRTEQFNSKQGSKEVNQQGPQQQEDEYPCTEPGCDASYPTPQALGLHASKHQEHKCPLCDEVPSTAGALSLHLRGRVHADNPKAVWEALQLVSKSGKPKPLKPLKGMPKLRVFTAPPRRCEYCDIEMPAQSIGGHHRGHLKRGDKKIVDGGDGATLGAKAIAATDSTPKPSKAVRGAQKGPLSLVVASAPASVTTETVAVNGTGSKDTPQALLNQIRAMVNPEMAGELERLRVRNTSLEAQVSQLTRERDDLQARIDMIKEATTV